MITEASQTAYNAACDRLQKAERAYADAESELIAARHAVKARESGSRYHAALEQARRS